MSQRDHPIGLFDSGVGGLTVLKALRSRLPYEDFIYLGDTARLPYGTKSPETVAHYAEQVARRLMQEGIKLLVVACNTASAQGLPRLHELFPELPCLGVIEPGAQAAAQASHTGRIVVLATEGTVRSGAYEKEILHHRPDAVVESLPCNLLVALAEEGWVEGPEAACILNRYFAQINLTDYDTVVLGCTHFPLLAPAMRRLLPPSVTLVDSAATTAQAVADFLAQNGLQKTSETQGNERFWVTDGPIRFSLMAQRFLGFGPIEGVEVTTV